MLAGKAPEDLSTLRFPLIASPKLDGIRCIIRDGQAVSRKLKPIPNAYVQEKLKGLPDGLDGELIVGDPFGTDVMNRTSSGVMSEDGEPDFTYWTFDKYNVDAGYSVRLGEAGEKIWAHRPLCAQIKWSLVNPVEELLAVEHMCVEQGYEGIMVRSLDGPYKQGRSTTKEGYLLKIKRFKDTEAMCIGVSERLHNANEATKDALGHTKRSSHKDNMIPMDCLGSLLCELPNGVRFDVGTGFTDEQRKLFWKDHGNHCIGEYVKVKYQDLTPDGKPRFPVFIGFRHPLDMD